MAAEVNFIALVMGVIVGPIAITWGALAFFMLMSEPVHHDKPAKQLDLFGSEDQ